MNDFAPLTAERLQEMQPAMAVTDARPYTKCAVQVHIPAKEDEDRGSWAIGYRTLASFTPNAPGLGMPGEGSAYFALEDGRQVQASVYRNLR